MKIWVLISYRSLSAKIRQIAVLLVLAAMSLPSLTAAQTAEDTSPASTYKNDKDIQAVQRHLSSLQGSRQLVTEIEAVIETTDENTPVSTRIDLDLWKLRALADISDTQSSAVFAYNMHQTYGREDYKSDAQYGDAMQQIVQAVAKTEYLGLAFEIVEHLRESVYKEPSVYLDFTIDRSLMEIYIETFDYERALAIELSILNNEAYLQNAHIMEWHPSLYNEIAFLYNRLGNGEKALEYSYSAREAIKRQNLMPMPRLRTQATNAGNFGRAYLLTKEYDQAESMGQFVVKSGKELEQNYLISLGYRLLGSAAYNKLEYVRALALLETGIALSERHGIATMQKFLYTDYALCLEALGRYEEALYWQKKQFSLELKAQADAAAARAALNHAEFNALETHREILRLKDENTNQRKISQRDRNIKKLLVVTILSLLLGGGVLIGLMWYMRRSQKRLVESEKKAQLANKAKSEFLANMSHEIRTPMNGVLGMAQVLERTSLTKQQTYYIDLMKLSGENLLIILNDILDYSKLEANKLVLNPEPENLERTLRETVAGLTPYAQDQNLELRYDFDPALPQHLMFDEDRVRQIMTNLIGNAIKFTKEGYVHIGVAGQAEGESVDFKIEVTDTGIGIAEDKIALIFEKFSQAESSTTRSYGGTGLGLSISRHLSEAMGGTLTATSQLGVGSVFTLKLSLDIADPAIDANAEASVSNDVGSKLVNIATPQRAVKKTRKGLHILVAEDDEDQLSALRDFLRHPRLKLTTVGTGADAVEAYRSNRFNMVFMDVSMPVLDGVNAAKAIRKIEADEGRLRTPIICLSAHAGIWKKIESHQGEIDGYLQKPVQKTEILETIQAWLKSQKFAA